MSPKRVCAISGSYFLRDPRVRREAEALAEAGWQVDVICLRAPNEPAMGELGSSIRIQRVPLQHKRGSRARYVLEYAAFFALASARLSQNHLEHGYDLVHIHNMPNALVFAAWLPKLTGTPILLDVHDPVPEIYQERFGISKEHWLNRILLWEERSSFAFAKQLIAVHDLVPPVLARSAALSKISVVMNAPDPKIFKQRIMRPHTARNGFTLVYTGTVSATYALDVAIEAVAQVRNLIPNICLRIIGEGDDLERLKQLTANLQLNEHVEFIPPVPLDEIPQILASADAAVSPHRDDPIAELCYSTKLVEALMFGLPVISSRTPAHVRYFDDTMLAYVELGDAKGFAAQVLRLYRNPAVGAEMVQNAGRFFAEHSWEQERARFYEVVETAQRS